MLFVELRLYRDTAAKDVLSVPFLQTLKEKSLGKNEHDAFFCLLACRFGACAGAVLFRSVVRALSGCLPDGMRGIAGGHGRCLS